MIRDRWTLDPEVVFLNHGSYGATPRIVLDAQAELRALLERQPVRFFREEYQPRLDASRVALCDFVGAAPEDTVLVENATSAVNAVLRSFRFAPGDEILTTNHAYNACRNALDWAAERAGARVVVAEVPFPLASADEIAAPVLAAVTPRTRLALLDHVTSPTAIVFPLAALVPALEARGVAVLVDGAHAPGMIPLSVAALGASYYAGNCHKWLCAPKGVGFLWVRADRQPGLVPSVVSHGLNAPPSDPRPRLHQLFDWTGTGDPTARLLLGACVAFGETLVTGGWPALMAANHGRAAWAQARLAAVLGVPRPCPPELLGSMASLPLPDGDADAYGAVLWREHRIEIPIFPWPAPPRRLLRVSLASYVGEAEIERLAARLV
jgi:isopenicillin-N epimerase